MGYSPDGTQVVSGGYDATLRIWDAKTGKPIREPLVGHTEPVTSVSYSPDGTRILSGSMDKTLRIWKLPDPGRTRTIERTSKIKEELMIRAWDPGFRGAEFILYMSEVDAE